MGEAQSLTVESPKTSFVSNKLVLILLQLFSLAPVRETYIARKYFSKFSEHFPPPLPPPVLGKYGTT